MRRSYRRRTPFVNSGEGTGTVRSILTFSQARWFVSALSRPGKRGFIGEITLFRLENSGRYDKTSSRWVARCKV